MNDDIIRGILLERKRRARKRTVMAQNALMLTVYSVFAVAMVCAAGAVMY